MRRYPSAVAALSLIVFAAACGGGDSSGSAQGGDTKLVVYSGREEELVEPLFKKFEQKTGIDVEVRYGDSAELAATLAEEGGNSPADVFFAQDPGSLGAVEQQGMLAKLSPTTLDLVPDRFRDPDGHWVGTSARARVVAYNTDELTEAELPDSVLDYTDPKWKGKIGLPPTNASFQAFVSSMVLSLGEERTRQWLEGIKANDPKLYEKNTPVVEAVAAGEIQVGFVNHYYLYLVKEEQPDAPVANDYLPGTDPGALVSVAGAAVLESADHKDAAARFVEYLLSEEGQRFYVDEAEEAEYPVIPGIEPKAGLPPLDSLQGPKIRLDDLGAQLEKTLELLNEVGFTA
jgi:iron(III) transport system substrate-binding protein